MTPGNAAIVAAIRTTPRARELFASGVYYARQGDATSCAVACALVADAVLAEHELGWEPIALRDHLLGQLFAAEWGRDELRN